MAGSDFAALNSSHGNCGGGFGFGQWFSLFCLDLNYCIGFAAIEIVNAEFVIVADAVGKGAFESRIKSWGHWLTLKRLQISD